MHRAAIRLHWICLQTQNKWIGTETLYKQTDIDCWNICHCCHSICINNKDFIRRTAFRRLMDFSFASILCFVGISIFFLPQFAICILFNRKLNASNVFTSSFPIRFYSLLLFSFYSLRSYETRSLIHAMPMNHSIIASYWNMFSYQKYGEFSYLTGRTEGLGKVAYVSRNVGIFFSFFRINFTDVT